MKITRRSITTAITVMITGATCAVAQTPKNYSWSGTSMTPPALYSVDSSGYAPPSYEMVNNRLHAASPGALGHWVGKQFDWPIDSQLGDTEKISGSITFRINSVVNSGGTGERLRLFCFNTCYSNGLPVAMFLMAADHKVTHGNWYGDAGGHAEWNKWEMNSTGSTCSAPAGKTYLYNSWNMKNPATDTDYSRLVDNGVDHVLSWSAQYDPVNDVVNVQTWLDGVSWTLTAVHRNYTDWFLFGGWMENQLAKAWPNMGAWDVEFSEIQWATTAATSNIKSYAWTGTGGGLPTIYTVDSNGNPPPTYANTWKPGRLHAASPGAVGSWVGKQFDWPIDSQLADTEQISGSFTFRINGVINSGGTGERLRLFCFNTCYSNGLPVAMFLYAADHKVTHGNWYGDAGGHAEWNKWEMNSGGSLGSAPAGKTYLYNSWNMKNPATDTDYSRLIDNGVDHVLSWSAQYDPVNDVVNVQTWLDGVSWTLTAVHRNYTDWFLFGGWMENQLAKAWPNMGAWDVELSEIKWETSPAAPTDVKNYWWTGTGGGVPAIYTVDSNGNPPPTYANTWKPGRLHAASPGALGQWSGKQFDWPCASKLANDEMISGSLTFRINGVANTGGLEQRLRLFTFNVPWANGLAGILHIMAADHRASRSDWKPGGHAEWNKWEMNSIESLGAAPAGMTYLYNSWNMDNPATDTDYCRAISNGVDHVLSWNMQYMPDRVRVTTALDGIPWTVLDVGWQSPDWFLNCGWTENAWAKAWPNMGAWDVEVSEIRWTTTKAVPNICWTKYPPSGQWEMRWWGQRLVATNIIGPWALAGGASPATPSFLPPAAPMRFWRAQGLQCP